MQKNPVQGVWYIGVNLFQIDDAMVKHNVEIFFPERPQGRVVLLLQILQQHIAHACQKGQHIAQPKQVVTVDVFPVPIIEIKIDPPEMSVLSVHQNVVPSYVPVFFAVMVEELDGLNAFYELIQDTWEFIEVIAFMIPL